MRPRRILAKLSKLFLAKSRALRKLLICSSNVKKLGFHQHGTRRLNNKASTRVRNEESQEYPSFLHGAVNQQETSSNVVVESIVHIGINSTEETVNKVISSVVGEVAEDDQIARRIAEEEEEEQQRIINEREARLRALRSLKEIEEMESGQLDQAADLNEARLCYSEIKNDFFVHLINEFIVDVSDGIRNEPM